MKTFQIFAAGVVVLILVLLLPSYESILAGVAAAIMLAAVVVGFLLRPRKDTFYLRTTLVLPEPDYRLAIEHDRVAIRVELKRLWLLFVPTFASVAFFIATSTKGTTWNFSLMNRIWETSPIVVYVIRIFQVLVVLSLSTWISERWVLRDVEACSAKSVSMVTTYLLDSFKDQSGEYYGGEAFPFFLISSRKLARIVFYRPSNPQVSKIAAGLLFHAPVIIAQGLTELDEATQAAHSLKVKPVSQTL
jgi:hypothetical protein